MSSKKFETIFRFAWERESQNSDDYESYYYLEDSGLDAALEAITELIKLEAKLHTAGLVPTSNEDSEATPLQDHLTATTPDLPARLEVEAVEKALYEYIPTFVLFEEKSGQLPSKIDVSENYQLKGEGASGASNFLTVAGIDLATLVKGNTRDRAVILDRANKKVTKDFLDFWTQIIGSDNRLSLECHIQSYGAEVPEKVGKPYLVFYICDGQDKLYPHQRSKGVSWFVTFYLQMRASEMQTNNRFYLLDEPGANLHSKAQNDVLKLINTISDRMGLIYSTHSGPLIEQDKLHRLLAVQRTHVDGESPTIVLDSHRLGAASRDTLSAVLNSMGIDMAHQQVVKKRNNVLLEEISAFYYLLSFWKLTGQSHAVQFIAATGVSNIPILVNCFLGWGLDFAVVMDDEASARKVYNRLKKDIFRDEEELAKTKLLKIKNCVGIEDIFSKADFMKFVLNSASDDVGECNSTYMKNKDAAKAIAALNFKLSVERGNIKMTDFDDSTQEAIYKLVADITTLVSNPAPDAFSDDIVS